MLRVWLLYEGVMMSIHIVIAGGTGYIGQKLSEELMQQQYRITILTRNPKRFEVDKRKLIRYVRWNPEDIDLWKHEIEDAYAIINLAGESIASLRWTTGKKRKIVNSRLNAGKSIIRAIEHVVHKPVKLIQASGIGYYGDRNDELLDEYSKKGKGFLSNVARLWESSVKQAADLDVQLKILRIGVVLGKDNVFMKRVMLPFKLFMGGHPGNGRQWMSWIHIHDLVDGIDFLLKNDTTESLYNMCSPNPVQAKDFYTVLGNTLNRPSWLPAPGFMLRMMLGEMANELILSGQRAVPKHLLEAGFKFQFDDLQTALQDLMKNTG